MTLERPVYIWIIEVRASNRTGYVARKWVAEIPPRRTDQTLRAPTLEAMRELMHRRGLVCLPHKPGDDPAIIEAWL